VHAQARSPERGHSVAPPSLAPAGGSSEYDPAYLSGGGGVRGSGRAHHGGAAAGVRTAWPVSPPPGGAGAEGAGGAGAGAGQQHGARERLARLLDLVAATEVQLRSSAAARAATMVSSTQAASSAGLRAYGSSPGGSPGGDPTSGLDAVSRRLEQRVGELVAMALEAQEALRAAQARSPGGAHASAAAAAAQAYMYGSSGGAAGASASASAAAAAAQLQAHSAQAQAYYGNAQPPAAAAAHAHAHLYGQPPASLHGTPVRDNAAGPPPTSAGAAAAAAASAASSLYTYSSPRTPGAHTYAHRSPFAPTAGSGANAPTGSTGSYAHLYSAPPSVYSPASPVEKRHNPAGGGSAGRHTPTSLAALYAAPRVFMP
jgi:hypothetical protein